MGLIENLLERGYSLESAIAYAHRMQREDVASLEEARASALDRAPVAPGTLPSWEQRDPATGRAVTMTYETTRYQRAVWQDNARFERKLRKAGVVESSAAETAEDTARETAREAARVARAEKKARTRAENAAREAARVSARAEAAARADRARFPRPEGGFSPTRVIKRAKLHLAPLAARLGGLSSFWGGDPQPT